MLPLTPALADTIYTVMRTNLSSVSGLELLNDGPSVLFYGCWTDRKKWKWLCTIFVFWFLPFLSPSPFFFLYFFYFRHYPGHRIQFLRDKLWGEELRCGNNQFEWGHGHKLGTARPYIKPWWYISLNKSSSAKLENGEKKKKKINHFV